jgi:endonuclease-3
MNKKTATEIAEKIINLYPNAKSSLDFKTPFQMLVAVCLSAQCTDARVNMVTPALFKKYKTPKQMANADINELEELVHSISFYKNKSKNLIAASKKIESDFDGIVPNDMELLQTLPGVGRKSANCIMLDAYNNPQGIAVDTHVGRISQRLGLSKETDSLKIEADLLKHIPKELWKDVNHTFILFGRDTCSSQNPKCDECPLKKYCKYKKRR